MNNASVKAYKGVGMDGLIAKWYAASTRRSLEEYKDLARRVAGELTPGSRVLELAPGPGYFAIELAKLGDYQITGIDISPTFVEIARRNATDAGVAIDFRVGNAASLPFEHSTFDFLLCRAAFKNFAQPRQALNEMYSVLRGGGRGLIIDLRRDSTREAIDEAVDKMGQNFINRTLTRLTFRFMLLRRAYTKSEFQRFFAETKFRAVDVREESIGLEVRFEK